MRRVAGFVLIAALALAQVTWAPRFEVGGAFPNLVLLVALGLTWTLGQRPGMVWACIGGVLLDLTASGPIGPHALALLTGVYATGLWSGNMERTTALHLALTAALATILYSVVLVLAAGLLGMPVPAPGIVGRLIVAAAAYNALLMPPAHEVLRRLQALTRVKVEPV